MAQFDQSSLKEFSYKNGTDESWSSMGMKQKHLLKQVQHLNLWFQQLHLQLHHKLQLQAPAAETV